MSLHALASEFCGCWENGPAWDMFVRIAAPGGEFAVREAPGGRFRVDWLSSKGGCETSVLSHSAARRRIVAISGYEHAVLRLPTPRQTLDTLLARFGFSLFGDCLMTPDGWLFCDVIDVLATIAVLQDRIPSGPLSVEELVRLLREPNPGG